MIRITKTATLKYEYYLWYIVFVKKKSSRIFPCSTLSLSLWVRGPTPQFWTVLDIAPSDSLSILFYPDLFPGGWPVWITSWNFESSDVWLVLANDSLQRSEVRVFIFLVPSLWVRIMLAIPLDRKLLFSKLSCLNFHLTFSFWESLLPRIPLGLGMVKTALLLAHVSLTLCSSPTFVCLWN